MTKPSFDEFHLALMYPESRRRLGIPLDAVDARRLLGDEMRTYAYYGQWTPTFGKVRERRRLPPGPHELKRNIFGWVMFVVLAFSAVAIVGVAAHAAVAAFLNGEPGSIHLPEWLIP